MTKTEKLAWEILRSNPRTTNSRRQIVFFPTSKKKKK